MFKLSYLLSIIIVILLSCNIDVSTAQQNVRNNGPDMSKYNSRVGSKYLDENKDKPGVTSMYFVSI